MRRLLLVPLFATFSATQSITFINPPPAGPAGAYADNPSYPMGFYLTMQWTPVNFTTDLMVIQDIPHTQPNSIFDGLPPGTSTGNWTIETNVSLAVSPVFFLIMYPAGQDGPIGNSHYFNITAGGGESAGPASHTVPLTSLPTGGPFTKTTRTAAGPASTRSSSSGASGLDTDAKITIGVAVPIAVIGLGLAAYIAFARKRD